MRPGWLALLGLMAGTGPLLGEQVAILAPASVTFHVTDVSATTGSGTVSVSYSGASLGAGKVLRVSVRAGAASFSTPAGAAISSGGVTWTASGASGGSGFSGTLSAGSHCTVYQSNPNPASGGFSLTFRLAPPGGGVKAVEQSLTLEWLFESVAQ